MAPKTYVKNAMIKRRDLIRLLAAQWPDITDATKIYTVSSPLLIIPGPEGGSIKADQQIDLPGESLDTTTGFLMAGYSPEMDSAAVMMPYFLQDDGRKVRLGIAT